MEKIIIIAIVIILVVQAGKNWGSLRGE